LGEFLATRKPGLYAVFRQASVTAAPPGRLPAGSIVVLLRFQALQQGGGIAMEMEGDMVVRYTQGCAFPYSEVANVPRSAFLLLPPGGVQSLTPTPTPPPRLSGDPVIDRYIRMAVDGDYRGLAASFDYFGEPCEPNPTSSASMPKCPDGVPAGSTVQGARIMACERALLRTVSDTEKLLRPFFASPHQLYAVFQTDGALYFDHVPTGDIAIVISGPNNESGRVIYLKNGKIVGIRTGCGESAPEVVKGVTSFVVPPK
jgi:hypothetical protein